MAGLGDLSVNAICHHLNKPCNSGHVEWSKVVHDTVKDVKKQFANEDEAKSLNCSQQYQSKPVQCGWCKFESLLRDRNLPKAGRFAY